jgi:hypothetical protein
MIPRCLMWGKLWDIRESRGIPVYELVQYLEGVGEGKYQLHHRDSLNLQVLYVVLMMERTCSFDCGR